MFVERPSGRLPGLVACILVAAGVLAMLLSSCSCREDISSPPESIVVAYSPFESTALFWIARDQQFFGNNGLEITLRKYDTGAASLSGVLGGEADIAVGMTEFPVVRMAFQQEAMVILGNANKGEFIYLIGRQDRDINQPADLKGKKIGVARGTIAEFYLGRFLELNGMKMQDVNIVDLKTPSEWVNAVVAGDVDAVVTAQPEANTAKERLGVNAIFWPAQSGQFLHGLMLSMSEWATDHPELVVRFLKSIAQAEDYALLNPGEAMAIVQEELGLDPEYMETVWLQNQFSLSLEQTLILAMEDEARWMIANNLTTEKAVPNFLDYIYTDGLKSVKPGSVKIPGK
ncbi:MAG: ABC transporter substrate-binding protein [Dehalococcoidaceae bacterium]|nr:ABC transporter substrate-binding protein [Dehalococcoidaceae bacterium]